MDIAPGLAAAVLGLASAASWGAGDFSGGLAARRSNVFGVVVISQMAGLALIVAFAVLSAERTPTFADLGWGAIGGLVGVVGLVSFYRALSLGQMGLTAPVAAVISAMLPVLFAAVTKSLPSTAQLAGFGLALIGVWLLSRPKEVGDKPAAGLPLAILAGLGFGGALTLFGQISPGAVFWPLGFARVISISTLTVIAFATQRSGWRPSRDQIPLIALAGVLDMGGNALFVLAAHVGRLDVAAVLSALYPASTVILARMVLKERLTTPQLTGLAAALVAVALIAS